MRPDWPKLASLAKKTWTRQKVLILCDFSLLSRVISIRMCLHSVTCLWSMDALLRDGGRGDNSVMCRNCFVCL